MTRVDKADILDLTVLHLQQLQQRNGSVSMATESVAYQSGFQACAREVMTYLTSQKSPDIKTIKALSDHLQATQPVPQMCVRNKMLVKRQMSTPVRINDVRKMSKYTLNTPDFSPITYASAFPEGYYHGRPFAESNLRISDSSNDSSSDSCYSSMNFSSMENSDVLSEVDVSIGHGDKIGHVIKDSFWRPF
ncbi:hypothetical protein DPMN_163764 [Dreissena polymorpha]|uniref:Orange domain-containing protein n=1 Tax=Dreissena polymorpha TaxID=45954 RepID=A0A9D4ETW6_DREPO|nr:hypothetical protein DPMN_163764 [Dreissena polymorpha]